MLKDAGSDQLRMRLGGIAHAFEVGRNAPEGFFTDYVFTGVQGVDHDLSVAGVIGADADEIDFGIGQKPAVVGGTARDTVLFAEFVGPFRYEIAQMDDLNVRKSLVAFDMGRRNHTAADDPALDHDETFLY